MTDYRGNGELPVFNIYTEPTVPASDNCPGNLPATANDSRGATLSEMIRVTLTPCSATPEHAQPGIGVGIPR